MYHTIGTFLRWLLDTKTLTGQIRSLLLGAFFYMSYYFNLTVCLYISLEK